MLGRMMDQQLLISGLIRHAAAWHGDTPVISRETSAEVTSTTSAGVDADSRRLAAALGALGLGMGDRCATIAWNNHRHLKTWFAVSGAGMVCHTINPRLFPEQLIFIINDADDKVIFFDKTFMPLIAGVRAHVPGVRHFIYMGPRDEAVAAAIDGVVFFDELVAGGADDYAWPELDERTPSSLCYTSGTTGNPKGVLYSHRSTLLHALSSATADSLNISAREVVLPVVPMFHVNAWGTPYVAAMVGATLVLPGPGLDGDSLVDLIEGKNVTLALGVPTIWQMLLAAAAKRGARLPSLKRNVIGGSACPPSMIATFRDAYGCETIHAWGMTETSPLGTVNQVKAKHTGLDPDDALKVRLSQGRPPYGVQLRIVGDDGAALPHDGAAQGALQIRGPWVVDSYFGREENALTPDGWFDTGDVATIDPDGYMTIRDRTKDIIKSGGEWISSVELEGIAVSHPGVAMAAAVAARHPKWDERPIIVVVKAEGAEVDEADILAHFDGKIAKWQMPDAVVFTDKIPIGGTGKILKNKLREEFGDLLITRGA